MSRTAMAAYSRFAAEAAACVPLIGLHVKPELKAVLETVGMDGEVPVGMGGAGDGWHGR